MMIVAVSIDDRRRPHLVCACRIGDHQGLRTSFSHVHFVDKMLLAKTYVLSAFIKKRHGMFGFQNSVKMATTFVCFHSAPLPDALAARQIRPEVPCSQPASS
jgi:hypothetical protein